MKVIDILPKELPANKLFGLTLAQTAAWPNYESPTRFITFFCDATCDRRYDATHCDSDHFFYL